METKSKASLMQIMATADFYICGLRQGIEILHWSKALEGSQALVSLGKVFAVPPGVKPANAKKPGISSPKCVKTSKTSISGIKNASDAINTGASSSYKYSI